MGDHRADRCIGRDEEIRRTIQILSRRTKNNPVLIGAPPGYVGYDPICGARPLKRAILAHVQDPLALLGGKFQRGDTVVADVEDGRIVFAKEVVAEVV